MDGLYDHLTNQQIYRDISRLREQLENEEYDTEALMDDVQISGGRKAHFRSNISKMTPTPYQFSLIQQYIHLNKGQSFDLILFSCSKHEHIHSLHLYTYYT